MRKFSQFVILCALGFFAIHATVNAADPTATSSGPTGLQPIDWTLVVLYALSTIGLGVYFSRKQESTQEYFVGSGNMNPILIGVSLFATLLSTITYLSMPGEAAGKGPVLMVSLLAYPFIFLIVAFGLLPVYMKQRVTSAYELLEERLGLSVRLLGACLFLVLRLVWMTLLVYMAAKAMTVMMGISEKWVTHIVLVTGLITIIYTSLGGLRAVVVTDLMQTILLFGGALLVLFTVTYHFGGLGWFPREWQPSWDTQPIFSTDPKTRVTVVGTVLSILAWYVATLGGDQTSVQRFMATKDAAAARKALAIQLCVGACVVLTLNLVGFALLGYFQNFPDQLPDGMTIKNDADKLFPRYIAFHLPVGISGLVVSAMFAAAMSSLDSGVNSVTAVVMTDFLDRFGKKPKTEAGHVLFARTLAFSIGAVVVFGSSYMKYIPGNITAVTNKTLNLLTTPIFALFIFALFIRRASPIGVWIGTFFGVVAGLVIAFSGPLVAFLYFQFGIDPALFNVELVTNVDPVTGETWTIAEDFISFQWIGPIALTVDIVTGTLASLLFPRRDRSAANEGL